MSRVASRGTAQDTEERTRVTTVDLRSDTVTKPTPEMRQAMAEAEVGDDVYGEDPTINRLEQRAAEIFGREAAIFVPSGTMGNTVAIKIHTRPGQEVICEERCHVFNYEMAMMAHFSGCLARPIHGEDGILRWAQVERKIPRTGVVARARAQVGCGQGGDQHPDLRHQRNRDGVRRFRAQARRKKSPLRHSE